MCLWQPRAVTATTDELCLRPATELAVLVRTREISARELLEAHLARIDRLDPRLTAIVTLDADGARAAADLAGLPLEQMLDEVLERLVDGRPEDDVALVAVRLHRQDRPRPAEAGPNVVPAVVPEDPAS